MSEINEIIYVPTLRCNYKCLHCGQNIFIKEKEEIACRDVANIVENLNLDNCEIFITGGEPFLRNDLEDFVLRIVNNDKTNTRISFTTNGYFTDKIISLIEKIHFKERISFSISVDAIGDTHNKIRGNLKAYDNAIKTIKAINQLGVNVSINTVIQRTNINELEYIKETISNTVGSNVKHDFIPEMIDVSKNKTFQFNDEEIRKMLTHTDSQKDVKYLLQRGNFKLKDCHAGLKNFVISPTGKIYTCLTGFSYFSNNEENQYYMGDIKNENIEEILEKRNFVYEKGVKCCRGCNNPCEIFREEKYFNLKYEITSENAEIVLSGENPPKYYLDMNWHPIEYINENNTLQWMSQVESNIFFITQKDNLSKIKMEFYSGCDLKNNNYYTSFYVNDIFYEKVGFKKGNNVYVVDLDKDIHKQTIIKITIKVDFVWKENSNNQSFDTRSLGVALRKLEFEYDKRIDMNMYSDKINEDEIREKIKLAIKNRKSIKNISVEKIVENIRTELGDSENINFNSLNLNNKSNCNFNNDVDQLTGWYSICKKINMKLREMPFYNKAISPVIEVIKRKVPKGAKYRDKLNYKELLKGNNTEFIYGVYSKILLRNPDSEGFEDYLNMLIRENGNRILVLGAIRYSAEGKQKDISIKGLYIRYKFKKLFRILCRIPILGYLIRWIKDIITMPKKFNNLFSSIIQQQISEENIYKSIDINKDELRNALEELKTNIDEEISKNIYRINEDINEINYKFEKINEEKRIKKDEEEKIKEEMDEVYLKFENQFRGKRGEIKNRLREYIPIIENVDKHNNHDYTNVIDLGCGRGEWLELLKENRFIYTGVDLNESMVNTCKELNLNVIKDDAISYLSTLEDSSVYVITGFQLVEHIGIENIVKLLKECYRVLKSGGMAIFETPNPENLIIGACNFYFDLTHKRPIPPTQLQFLAESCDFDRVDILRLHPYNVIDTEKIDTKNEEILKMANFFNNMADYSILAYKQ